MLSHHLHAGVEGGGEGEGGRSGYEGLSFLPIINPNSWALHRLDFPTSEKITVAREVVHHTNFRPEPIT